MPEAAAQRNSRDAVVQAALVMLGRGGLPSFSMRALARELGVQPSALYWHFADKQTLLAAVADAMLATLPPAEPTETPADAAAALRSALLHWHDGAEILSSSLALGLCSDAALQRLAHAFDGAGLRRDRADEAALATLQFVLGHVALEQQRSQAVANGIVVRTHPVRADATTFTAGLVGLLAGFGGSNDERLKTEHDISEHARRT